MPETSNKAVKDKIRKKRKEIEVLRVNIKAYGDPVSKKFPEGEKTAQMNKLLEEVRKDSEVFDK